MDWDGNGSFDPCVLSVSGCKGGSPCPRQLYLMHMPPLYILDINIILLGSAHPFGKSGTFSETIFPWSLIHGRSQTTTSLLPAKSHAEMRI
jgi:hypothetical protein